MRLSIAVVLCGCGSIVQRFDVAPVPIDGVLRSDTRGPAVMLERERRVQILERRVRIRDRTRLLVTSSGGLSFGRVRVFLGDREELVSVKARSCSPSGESVELAPESIAFQEYAEGASMLYSSSRIAVFDVPGVSVGDVIEYEIELESAQSTLPPWFFESRLPVEVSRYVVEFPEGTRLATAYAADGRFAPKPPQVEKIKGGERWTWTETKLKPIEDDPRLAPYPVRTRQLWVALSNVFPDWKSIALWYEQLTSARDPDDVLDLPREGNAEHWFRFVRDGVRYLGYYQEYLDGFRPHAPDLVLRSRFGDCKDMATLLVALYGRAGIQASPVLVRARDGLLPESVPTSSAFDHVIVAVHQPDGSLIFADATDKDLAFGSISDHLAGKLALLVEGPSSRLVKIPVPSPEQNVERVAWRLQEPARVVLTVELEGEESRAWRSVLRERAQPNLHADFLTGYLSAWAGTSITSVSSTIAERSITARAEIEVQELAWDDGDERVHPMARFFSDAIDVQSPRAQEITLSLALDPADQLVHMPAPQTVGDLTVEARLDGGEIRIARRIRTKDRAPGAVAPEELQRAMKALHRDAIVIRRGKR